MRKPAKKAVEWLARGPVVAHLYETSRNVCAPLALGPLCGWKPEDETSATQADLCLDTCVVVRCFKCRKVSRALGAR